MDASRAGRQRIVVLVNGPGRSIHGGRERRQQPLQPTLGANIQNYYVSNLYGIDGASSNSLLLRGTMPHKLFGRPQLLRLTIPVVTSPDVRPNGSQTGLGDLNIFDTFLFKNNLQLQPLVIRNFPKGWYARSTALWTWDLDQDTYYIPLGLGVWKVWAGASKKTVNVFAEPQWTVAHKGDGVPKFQLFAGLNLQFSLVR